VKPGLAKATFSWVATGAERVDAVRAITLVSVPDQGLIDV